MVRWALRATESGKRGSGLRSLASAAISAKVWPEPAKSFSALSELKIMESWRPAVSLNSGAARSMVGCVLLRVIRDHGISWEAGLGMTIYPMAPAAFKLFQRSSIEEN